MADPARKAEDETEEDPVEGRTRATGGVEDADAADQASLTGTTPNEEYVGRVSGADPGAAGETGAERRAESPGGAEPGPRAR